MALLIIRNDITRMTTDAIVNTANPLPVIGDGTDSAIHKAAGPGLLKAREAIGDIPRGESRVTDGYNLKARYVIHTVGGHWDGDSTILRSCYTSALQAAAEIGCRSVAFPLLAAGSYGCPVDISLQIAKETFRSFLDTHEMDIYLVLFSADAVHSWLKENSSIQAFIDDHYEGIAKKQERSPFRWPGGRRRREAVEADFRRLTPADFRTEREYLEYRASLEESSLPTADEETLSAYYSAPHAAENSENFAPCVQHADEVCMESCIEPGADVEPDSDASVLMEPNGDFSKEACYDRVDTGASALPPMPSALPDGFKAIGAAPKKSKALGKAFSKAVENAFAPFSLEEALKIKDEGFLEMLFRKIDEDGRKESQIYKAANINKSAFSKLRTSYLDHKAYTPKRETVFALAIALKLNLEETRELMLKAGYGMSRSIMTDVIVEYYITHKHYDIDDVNIALFDHDCLPLGSV